MEYLRTLTREFDVGERATLDIENRSGTIGVRGEETRQARIEVLARIWAESDDEADDQFELVARGIRQEDSRIIVRAPALLRPSGFLGLLTRGPRIDYQLTVPRESSGQLAQHSGPIEVTGVAGPLQIEARSGRVTVSQIGADTTIASRSGTVQAERIAGALVIDSRSGGVRVRGCKGSLSIESRSGSLQIEDVGGDTRLVSRSGSVSIADVGGALTLHTRSGAVRYAGGVHGAFDIDVTSGSVQLAFEPNSVFFLDAETHSGTVRSEFSLKKDGSAPSDHGPTVRIRTHSGSIHIVPR
ncbi:MAG: DUF4097 family beta strand repeat-containing protein [Dehalococcoidia bacterium]